MTAVTEERVTARELAARRAAERDERANAIYDGKNSREPRTRLEAARRRHRLTLADVVAGSGVSHVTVWRLERGDVTPGLAVMHRLAAFYETSIEELFGDRV